MNHLFYILHSFVMKQFLLFWPAIGHISHLIRSNICKTIELVHFLYLIGPPSVFETIIVNQMTVVCICWLKW
jgi:hypothetical protein